MAGDGGTTHHALIPRRRHDQGAVMGGVIQRLFHRTLVPAAMVARNPALRLMTRAPASTLSTMASRQRLRESHPAFDRSHSGLPQRSGAATACTQDRSPAPRNSRRADRTPATNVPCLHAALPARRQAPTGSPGSSRIDAPVRSGCVRSTGPSTRATVISRRPSLRRHQGGESDHVQRGHLAGTGSFRHRCVSTGFAPAPFRLIFGADLHNRGGGITGLIWRA